LEEALELSSDRILNEWMNNPSGRTMALGSTQPLTEMRTKCISWGVKGKESPLP